LDNVDENNSTALEGTQRDYKYRLVVGTMRAECKRNIKQIFKCYVAWPAVLMKAGCCKIGPEI